MLDLHDLHRTLWDDRHLGWGYQCCDVLSPAKRRRLDAAIVAVANECGLDYERLFVWSNSKWGRWLADGTHGCDEPCSRATVRRYLNDEIINELLGEEVEIQCSRGRT